MNLNKAFILGNLTNQPESKALPSGQSVVNFGVATNRYYTDKSGEKQQDTQFHNIVAFGKLADISSRYLKKGGLVLVEGRIRTRSWQDSSNNRRYRTEIIARNIQLPPKSWSTSSSSGEASKNKSKTNDIPIIEEERNTPPKKNKKPKNKNNKKPNKSSSKNSSEEEIDVEDIPF